MWFVPPVQLLSVGALEGMSALRRSEDLLSLKTRRIVIQNEDSSYPPAGAVLAMDSKGRGGTVITQDLSLNSIALLGDLSAGVLTYSDVSGLLLNSEPISGLPAPVPFDSVPDSANLSDLIESYNELLAVLNGTLITVNPPPVVTGLVATPGVNTADLSWNSVGSGYTYTVDLCGSDLVTDVSGTTYRLTSLVPTTSYTASVSAHNNSVFSGPASSVPFTTGGFPVVTGLTVSSIDVSAASVSWASVGGGYTYNIYKGPTFLADVSGTSYSLTGLTATTAYTISIRVTDGIYQGAPASASFTTATPLTVTASAVTGTGAKIAWTSAGSGYAYNLQILQGSAVIETLTGLTDLSYSVTDLSDSTAYIASVRFTSSGFTSSSAYTTTFTTIGSGFSPIQGFYTQTRYNSQGIDSRNINFGLPPNYFDSTKYGSITRSLTDSPTNIAPIGYFISLIDPGYAIYRTSFYISPPTNIMGILLWIISDDGCVINYTECDINGDPTGPTTNLITNWIQTAGASSGGPWFYPADINNDGIVLNWSAGSYYKFDCVSMNVRENSYFGLYYSQPNGGSPFTYTTSPTSKYTITTISAGPSPPTSTSEIPPSWYYTTGIQ